MSLVMSPLPERESQSQVWRKKMAGMMVICGACGSRLYGGWCPNRDCLAIERRGKMNYPKIEFKWWTCAECGYSNSDTTVCGHCKAPARRVMGMKFEENEKLPLKRDIERARETLNAYLIKAYDLKLKLRVGYTVEGDTDRKCFKQVLVEVEDEAKG